MDQKTKTKNQSKRPYDDYLDSPMWPIIEKELDSLVENQDLEITTDPYYVIGSLVKVLSKKDKSSSKKKMV